MFKEKIKSLPHLPGVYIFKNINQKPIYIGKAKSLKKRVTSYFKETNKDWKLDFLMTEIDKLDFIITKNETEALLLEAELVRKYQPKFNMLLKDGQPFIYILVSTSKIPELKLTRNKKEKGEYFGPFLYKRQVRSIYYFLLDSLRLRICNKKISDGCLQYHLGHCCGSCRPDFDKDAYLFRLSLALKLLKGDYEQTEKQLATRIEACNKKLLFEQSKKLTHINQNLSQIIKIIKLRFTTTTFDGDIKVALNPKNFPQFDVGKKLRKLLKLNIEPKTIDCFDISHFQSHHIVGSCIRFVQGIPDKAHFRRFKIKTLSIQNDYAALQEIVQRRYRNIKDIPDLILIDGGKGQRNIIQQLLHNTVVISLAKENEILFSSSYTDGLKLDLQTEEGKMLIALRDYSHHFAITYHRTKRGKFLM